MTYKSGSVCIRVDTDKEEFHRVSTAFARSRMPAYVVDAKTWLRNQKRSKHATGLGMDFAKTDDRTKMFMREDMSDDIEVEDKVEVLQGISVPGTAWCKSMVAYVGVTHTVISILPDETFVLKGSGYRWHKSWLRLISKQTFNKVQGDNIMATQNTIEIIEEAYQDEKGSVGNQVRDMCGSDLLNVLAKVLLSDKKIRNQVSVIAQQRQRDAEDK